MDSIKAWCEQVRVGKLGFALPTVMIVSIVMLSLLATAMHFVSASQASLDKQYHLQLSREAAESGLKYASKCLDSSDNVVGWSDAKPLRPNTDCSGNVISGADNFVFEKDLLRTSFTIKAPVESDDKKTISSEGTVQLLRRSDNQVRGEYTQVQRAYVGTNSVSEMTTSADFACSLVDGSRVYCWGKNTFEVLGPNASAIPNLPSRIDNAPSLAGKVVKKLARGAYGSTHMCLIADGDTEGEVYCWGNNSFGQLGNGTGDGSLKSSAQPVKVIGALAGKKVLDVSIGSNGSCAITSDGVYCWGRNNAGQLGNNSTQPFSNVSVKVAGISTAQKISYGDNHVCAVSSGKAYCWGWGQFGQIGNGSTGSSADRRSATLVSGLIKDKVVTDVTANHANSCAIANGKAYCWGDGGAGSLGNGSNSSSSVPVKVSNGSGTALYGKTVSQISGGFKNVCVLTTDGKAYCWGANLGVGSLGNNSPNINYYEAVKVQLPSGLGPATSISSSGRKSCVVMSGKSYCWGEAYDGQLREGIQEPQLVNNGDIKDKNIKYVAAGDGTTCVVITSGSTASCWGSNLYGQLGNDTFDNSTVPTTVKGLTGDIKGISTSGQTVCTTLGSSFYCWGQNTAGKVGNNTLGSQNHYQAVFKESGILQGKTAQVVSAGDSMVTCGIASDRTYCWGGYAGATDVSALGNNKTLQSGTDTYYTKKPVEVYRESGVLSGKSVTDISDGGTCVIASSRAYCWGENRRGQLGIGSFSAGSSKPVAVMTEAGVLQNKDISSIASGSTGHVCVSTTEPNIYCWGYNFDGEYGDGTRTTTNKPRLVTKEGNPLKGKTIDKLVAGSSHTCAMTNGEVYCWGYNSLGQLGNGTNASQLLPVKVGGALAGKTVTDLSAGGQSTCAIAEQRTYCWGSNDYGQMGDGTVQAFASPIPAKALSLPPFLYY